jgi:putative addiction module component (TIGR02574 family)
MATIPDDLTAAALRLPPALRAELAERLIASLEDDLPVHPEWRAELDRRDEELDRDPSLAHPADEVFRRIRSRLAR